MCSALPFSEHSLVTAILAVVTIIFKIMKDHIGVIRRYDVGGSIGMAPSPSSYFIASIGY